MVEDESTVQTQHPSSLAARPEAEAEVTNAIQRVYKQYGQNLSAFFRDVQSELRHNEQGGDQLPLLGAAIKRS